MNKPQRTPEGKWAIYHGTTGQRIDRWPVDAKAMIATGEYTGTPPEGVAPDPLSPEDRGIVENPKAILPKDKRGEGPQQQVHHAAPRQDEPEATGPALVSDEAPAENAEPATKEAQAPAPAAPVAPVPSASRTELPPGYSTEKRGRFVTLTGPDGSKVESGTPSGKHDGDLAAIAAAWAHHDAQGSA